MKDCPYGERPREVMSLLRRWIPVVWAVGATVAGLGVVATSSSGGDLFRLAVAVAFFSSVNAAAWVSRRATGWILAQAAVLMLQIGMRFDAAPALIGAGALVVFFGVVAVWKHLQKVERPRS